jgi:hypothetical protein
VRGEAAIGDPGCGFRFIWSYAFDMRTVVIELPDASYDLLERFAAAVTAAGRESSVEDVLVGSVQEALPHFERLIAFWEKGGSAEDVVEGLQDTIVEMDDSLARLAQRRAMPQ